MENPSKEIILRPWHMSDIESLAYHANNNNVAKALTDDFPFPYTKEEAQSWISFCSKKDPNRQLAIVYRSEPIGNIGVIIQGGIYRKTGEVGYWIGENFWGRGIMANALVKFTQVCFDEYGLHRLQARVCTENLASGRVLEKAGYQLQCILKKEVIKNHQVLDAWLYDKVC